MPGAMRVVMFASFEFGYLALEAARAFAQRFPEKLFLAALVTDDPVNPEARIGLKKRIWKYFNSGERVHLETAIADSALGAGMDVFTGEVKVDGFRQRLVRWRPDAILSCGFGQVIDAPIIQAPPWIDTATGKFLLTQNGNAIEDPLHFFQNAGKDVLVFNGVAIG